MSDEIKEFAKEISDKLHDKWNGRRLYLSDITESIRQMIEYKLDKENWAKIPKEKPLKPLSKEEIWDIEDKFGP